MQIKNNYIFHCNQIGYRNSPRLTHLLFADDSFFFCRDSKQEYNNILEILYVYGGCSGQQINMNKTAIFFSKLTLEEKREHIKQALGLSEIKQYEKYLGLPSFVGRRKKESQFQLYKGEGLEETTRLGGKIAITSRERDPDQSSSASNTHLHHELLQTPPRHMQ